MREKYIDERWPLLMVQGYHIKTKQPCVTDCDDRVNIFVNNEAQANELVAHYARLHAEFSALIQAFDKADPKAFEEFWYTRNLNQGS